MLMNQAEYLETISAIKNEIKGAQYRAVLGANRELITLYWRIGQVINAHKTWGNKFVENLAADIKLEFPNATGYSVRNLKYMAKFAAMFREDEIVQAALAQISWYHNIALMDKVKNADAYRWYAEQSAQNGWSRNVLVHQIESGLYERQALSGKVNNFLRPRPNTVHATHPFHLIGCFQRLGDALTLCHLCGQLIEHTLRALVCFDEMGVELERVKQVIVQGVMLLLQPVSVPLPPNPDGSFVLVEEREIGDKIVALPMVCTAMLFK